MEKEQTQKQRKDMTPLEIYEEMRREERVINRLKLTLEEMEQFPLVVLANNPMKQKPYYEQDPEDNKRFGNTSIRDLPPELTEIVRQWLIKEIERHQKQFDELERGNGD